MDRDAAYRHFSFATIFMTMIPLDPPAAPSHLPSPPISPIAPERADATRIRTKPRRKPFSLGNISVAGFEAHEERTWTTSPKTMTTEPFTPSSESKASIVAHARAAAGKRRQSSIAYYTPTSPSPWSQRPSFSRTFSPGVDSLPDVEFGLVNGKESVSRRSSVVPSSRSPSTPRDSVFSVDGAGAREREPLTLVEK